MSSDCAARQRDCQTKIKMKIKKMNKMKMNKMMKMMEQDRDRDREREQEREQEQEQSYPYQPHQPTSACSNIQVSARDMQLCGHRRHLHGCRKLVDQEVLDRFRYCIRDLHTAIAQPP